MQDVVSNFNLPRFDAGHTSVPVAPFFQVMVFITLLGATSIKSASVGFVDIQVWDLSLDFCTSSKSRSSLSIILGNTLWSIR